MALSFNGSSNHADSASALSGLSGLATITAAFWINTVFAADDDILLELSVDSNSNVGSFKVIGNEGGTNKLWADVFGNVGKADGEGTAPSNSAWHHIAAILDFTKGVDAEVAIYVDGSVLTLANTNHSNNTGTFGSYVLYVMSRAGTSLFADGSIADLGLWSTALTGANITSLQTARANTVAAGSLVYYWTLTSDGTATTGGINLTVTGASTVADPPALASAAITNLAMAPMTGA